MSETKRKLIIEKDTGERNYGITVKISARANALVEDIMKRANRPKSYIVNKMIEFAYDYVEVDGEDDE